MVSEVGPQGIGAIRDRPEASPHLVPRCSLRRSPRGRLSNVRVTPIEGGEQLRRIARHCAEGGTATLTCPGSSHEVASIEAEIYIRGLRKQAPASKMQV